MITITIFVLLCYINWCQSFTFPYIRFIRSSLHSSSFKQYVDDINLGQIFEINKFIESYENSLLQGVFALEDEEGNVIHLDGSKDVYLDVKNIFMTSQSNNIKNIRIQTFKNPTDEFITSYKEELLSQLQDDSESSTVKSPFESSTGQILELDDKLDLTSENVNKVLDEVRPYLIADGGNIAVVSVDNISGDVVLQLQGACGSCPSSTTTMKMGVERVLRERFPEIANITAIDDSTSAVSRLSVDMINQSLEKILPAVKGLGGTMEVMKVDQDSGTVTVKFSGPAKLKQGISLILKDNELVKHIVFE